MINLFNNRESAQTELSICKEYINLDEITTQYGTLKRKNIVIDNHKRHYIIFLPDNPTGILVYYHGSRGNAWMSALNETKWIEHAHAQKEQLIIVYGQAEGKIEEPHIHPHYGGVSYGELYWEVRNNTEQFDNDIKYTREIISREASGLNRKYFVGHSNGGVFGCLVAIFLSDIFTGVISHMGGIGYDPHFYLDFSRDHNKIPILFYTGEHDIHKFPSEAAQSIFLGEDYTIADIYIEPNIGHEYCPSSELFILDWIKKHY